MVSSASQPRSTFPDRKSAGSPPCSMVTAESSSATMLAAAAPARPSCAASRSFNRRSSPAAPAVSVTAGISRVIIGPCSWVV